MGVEDLQDVIHIINFFVAGSPEGKLLTKEVIAKLARYCPLRNIPKLCFCHIVAQKYPGVIIGTRKIVAIYHDSDTE